MSIMPIIDSDSDKESDSDSEFEIILPTTPKKPLTSDGKLGWSESDSDSEEDETCEEDEDCGCCS